MSRSPSRSNVSKKATRRVGKRRAALGSRRGNSPLPVAQHRVNPHQVGADHQVRVAIAVEISGGDRSVVVGARPPSLQRRKDLTVAGAEVDHRKSVSAALRRRDDVEQPVAVHVGDIEAVPPRAPRPGSPTEDSSNETVTSLGATAVTANSFFSSVRYARASSVRVT